MPTFILCQLKGKKKFETLFDNGKKFYTEKALAIVLFKKKTNEAIESYNNKIFFAVSVPKKFSKKAVVRNRIKRLLRVSIRNNISDEINCDNIESFSIIWRDCPSKPSLIRLQNVEPVVKELINRIAKFKIEE